MTDNIPLREYIEKIIDEREKHAHLALEIASKDIERRLSALNELRSEVMSDRSQYVLQAIFEARLKEIISRINLTERLVYIGIGIVFALQFLFQYLRLE